MANEAWVTLATNDSYAIGVMVLAHSLRAVQTTRPLVVMVGDHVSPAMRFVNCQHPCASKILINCLGPIAQIAGVSSAKCAA